MTIHSYALLALSNCADSFYWMYFTMFETRNQRKPFLFSPVVMCKFQCVFFSSSLYLLLSCSILRVVSSMVSFVCLFCLLSKYSHIHTIQYLYIYIFFFSFPFSHSLCECFYSFKYLHIRFIDPAVEKSSFSPLDWLLRWL